MIEQEFLAGQRRPVQVLDRLPARVVGLLRRRARRRRPRPGWRRNRACSASAGGRPRAARYRRSTTSASVAFAAIALATAPPSVAELVVEGRRRWPGGGPGRRRARPSARTSRCSRVRAGRRRRGRCWRPARRAVAGSASRRDSRANGVGTPVTRGDRVEQDLGREALDRVMAQELRRRPRCPGAGRSTGRRRPRS